LSVEVFGPTDLPDSATATLFLACTQGQAVSGGFSVDKPVLGVSPLYDAPARTPSPADFGWEVSLANGSGIDLQMTLFIVCVISPPANSSAAGAAPAPRPRILKKVITKLRTAA
jgi:hypothetical protein